MTRKREVIDNNEARIRLMHTLFAGSQSGEKNKHDKNSGQDRVYQ